MKFCDKLNEYLEQIPCTAKELAENSGISAPLVSRYRSGEREPSPESENVDRLAAGLAKAAGQRRREGFDEAAVREALLGSLKENSFDYRRMQENLNSLFSVLDVNQTEMARAMNFDASYLSRIRSGQRRPPDPEDFAQNVARFTAEHYRRSADRAVVSSLIGCPPEEIAEDMACASALKNWLCSGRAADFNSIRSFLRKMDEFDLDAYIRAIHFNDLRIPTVPIQLPVSHTYYGLEEIKNAELDFLKATVLSPSMDAVVMYSDTPMEELAGDLDFSKKWMYGMAMMLKKGLHLNMIHNLERPFGEMMLGLESFIPMYMTGQISPYYFRGASSSVFCHFHKVSGSAALAGECIAGFQENSRYYFTKKRNEVAYFHEKSSCMMKKAQPLMDIYRENSANVYEAFQLADAQTEGNRHDILSALPLYTISEDLLRGMLNRVGTPQAEAERILIHAAWRRNLAETVLAHGSVLDEVPELTEEEFSKYPMALSLSGIFFKTDIPYTYGEYLQHLKLTEEFSGTHPGYTARMIRSPEFRNIQIYIHEGKWAMVSKGRSPAIHFVIRHPKLRAAIENMTVPVLEN